MCRRIRLRSRHCGGRGSYRKRRGGVRTLGGSVQAVQADLATTEGVDKLCAAVGSRPVDALLANAGIGLGKAFLDQDFQRIRRLVDTNITGTLYLIHRVGKEMLQRNSGRVLITGSIAGFTSRQFPGRLQCQQGVP
jgi:uncharacterized protein